MEGEISFDCLNALLEKKGYFSKIGLDRFETMLSNIKPEKTCATQQTLEAALIAFLMSLKADEAKGNHFLLIFSFCNGVSKPVDDFSFSNKLRLYC